MNISTSLRRLGVTAVGIVAAAAIAAPAADAQRVSLPAGGGNTAGDRVPACSESAGPVADRARPEWDIAYAVETRKAEQARFRVDYARELAANR